MSRVLISDIKQVVAAEYGVTLEDLRSPSTARRITLPRQVAMNLAVNLTPMGVTRVGRVFGRNHSTVLKGMCSVARANVDLWRLESLVLVHAAGRRKKMPPLPPPPKKPEVHAKPTLPDGAWQTMDTAPHGTVLRVLVKGPRGFRELPYPVVFADGQWRYAANNGRVFPWHRPLRWRVA